MNKVTQSELDKILQQEEISNICFINVNFSGYNFSGKKFFDCSFDKCNISNIPVKNTMFNGVQFRKSRLLGLKFTEIQNTITDIEFLESNIEFCSFFGLELKKTLFQDSEIKECDFVEANLEHSIFLYCNIEKSIFSHTNLSYVDFTGSYNFVIHPSKNTLEKTKFTRENSIGLLQDLDIVIE